MTLTQTDIYYIFMAVGLLALLGLLFALLSDRKRLALLLVSISAFFLRFAMTLMDPFLHEWDEKYHALVAKNMLNDPFTPTLYANPVFKYDYTSWCCNHIWLHKQPLFLWQMAASMKIFGVSIWALRFPAVLMGTLSVLFIYQIANIWFRNNRVAFLAALLYAFLNYQLELTSARYVTDQNDVAFAFYLLGSFWAFAKYSTSKKRLKWAAIIGFFVAGAILNKWLTGLLVYSGWFVFIFADAQKRFKLKSYFNMMTAIVVSLILFLPWQIYTRIKFPKESIWENEYNAKHLFEAVENHDGDIYFHFISAWNEIGSVGVALLFIGIIFSLFKQKAEIKLSMAYLSMSVILFAFFSIVATKMSSFTFSGYSLLVIFIAAGFVSIWELLLKIIPFIKKSFLANVVYLVLAVPLVYSFFRPMEIASYRRSDNEARNRLITNTHTCKKIDPKYYANGRIVLNLKSFNQIDMMFYNDLTAYHWWPGKEELDSLKSEGFEFSAFRSRPSQVLPDYILEDPDILIIDKDQK